MLKDDKIFVAGHRGLVGSALLKNLKARGYTNIVTRTHAELDLINADQVASFFEKEKPQYVFLAAAKVGGIVANNTYRADFIYQNLQIQNNIIHNAYLNNVEKLLFLGSSCIYPKGCPQPIKEDYLLTGELEYTNEPYALAKIAGINMCESYNLQYGTNFIAVMPTNLYGDNDNYNLETSHVLPALIRKFQLVKCLKESNWELLRRDLNERPIFGTNGDASNEAILLVLKKFGIEVEDNKITLSLWGSGNPRREFMHSTDMADACIHVMNSVDFDSFKQAKEVKNTHINIGTGTDISIKDLALLIRDIVGVNCDIEWDRTKPDGTFQKLLDVEKLHKLGWSHRLELTDGVKQVYESYIRDLTK